jgi:hypothetical protein
MEALANIRLDITFAIVDQDLQDIVANLKTIAACIILVYMETVLEDSMLFNVIVILDMRVTFVIGPLMSAWPILVKIAGFVLTEKMVSNVGVCLEPGAKTANIITMIVSITLALMVNVSMVSTVISVNVDLGTMEEIVKLKSTNA